MGSVVCFAVPYTAITIVFIVVAAVVGAFVRRRRLDKCLKDFAGDVVILEDAGGKEVWGTLRVENTGLEFVYDVAHADADGHDETSFILYKGEYDVIGAVVRYHEKLSDKCRGQREKEMSRTYHPNVLRRLKRRVLNVFATVRDSVAEIVNLLLSQAKKASPAGAMLGKQDKYVTQMKTELMGSSGASYEPLLERYIGHKVVLEVVKGDRMLEYCGVLKEYTADFVEVMDVNYRAGAAEAKKADLVVPRRHGVVRHSGE